MPKILNELNEAYVNLMGHMELLQPHYCGSLTRNDLAEYLEAHRALTMAAFDALHLGLVASEMGNDLESKAAIDELFMPPLSHSTVELLAVADGFLRTFDGSIGSTLLEIQMKDIEGRGITE